MDKRLVQALVGMGVEVVWWQWVQRCSIVPYQ